MKFLDLIKSEPIFLYWSGKSWSTGSGDKSLSSDKLLRILQKTPDRPVSIALNQSSTAYKTLPLSQESGLRKLNVLYRLFARQALGDTPFSWRYLRHENIQLIEGEQTLPKLKNFPNPVLLSYDWATSLYGIVKQKTGTAASWVFVLAPSPGDSLHLVVAHQGAVIINRSINKDDALEEINQTRKYLKRFGLRNKDSVSFVAFKKINLPAPFKLNYLSQKNISLENLSTSTDKARYFPKVYRPNLLANYLPKLTMAFAIPLCVILLGYTGSNLADGYNASRRLTAFEKRISRLPKNLTAMSEKSVEEKKYFVLFSDLSLSKPTVIQTCSVISSCYPNKVMPVKLSWDSSHAHDRISLEFVSTSEQQRKTISSRIKQSINVEHLTWKQRSASSNTDLHILLRKQ